MVAQIYGVGIITSRFTGVEFGVGVFLGLAGILVCSFLGGMRAVTWTQVAQYIILIIAYMIPVVWLSVKITGVPVPQLVYGQVLQKVTAKEGELKVNPGEVSVRDIFKKNAADAKARIDALPASWEQGRATVAQKVEDLKAANAPVAEIRAAEKALADYPKTADAAKTAWAAQVASNTARSAPPSRTPRRTRRPRPGKRASRTARPSATTSSPWCSA